MEKDTDCCLMSSSKQEYMSKSIKLSCWTMRSYKVLISFKIYAPCLELYSVLPRKGTELQWPLKSMLHLDVHF